MPRKLNASTDRNDPRIVGVVHAKGSSSRIPEKNTQEINAQPLFLLALQRLRRAGLERVFLDSDSRIMLSRAQDEGFEVFARDSDLASNGTNGHQLLLNFAQTIQAQSYLQLSCTAPFISQRTLSKMIDAWERLGCGAFLVRRHRIYRWSECGSRIVPHYDVMQLPNSFQLPPTIEEITAAYMVDRRALIHEKSRISMNSLAFEIGAIESLDINDPGDLSLARTIAAAEPELLTYGPMSDVVSSSWSADRTEWGREAQV